MKCPIDNIDLVMADRQGIEIDYCPKCRGVWLDRGELDKIIERSAPAQQPQQSHDEDRYQAQDQRAYDQGRRCDDDHHRPYKKKKKSFLDDIFDF